MRLASVVTSRTRSPSMITIALDQILPLPSHNFPNRTALILFSVCAGEFCCPNADSGTSAIPSAMPSTEPSIGAISRILIFKYPLIPRSSVPDSRKRESTEGRNYLVAAWNITVERREKPSGVHLFNDRANDQTKQ